MSLLENRALIFVVSICSFALHLQATVVTIPNSALTPSSALYTNSFGNVVVMTDGGNAPGIGDVTGRNDDGFSGPIDLGFTLNFFGKNYTQFWINNNGSVSFGNGISDFIPVGPTGALQPVISAYFGDVDTRDPASGVVHLSQVANQNIITWDNVGYFDSHGDKLNSFQIVLRGPGYNVPVGEGQIGFFYTNMQWDATDTSTTSAVGFGDGAQNGEILQGSLSAGLPALLNNHHIWFDVQNGVPVTIGPEPRPALMFAFGLSALLVFFRKFRRISAQ